MIVRDRPPFLAVIFTFRHSVLSRIYPQVLAIMALSLAIVVAHKHYPGLVPVFDGAPFALLGVALSVFLGFRNSACYDRWWEARKQWGLLSAASRDLARKTLILERRGDKAIALRREILSLAMAFAYGLETHLRGGAPLAEALRRVPEPQRAGFAASERRPLFALGAIGERLADLRAANLIDSQELLWVDATLAEMNGALAACERLRHTPVPFGYTLLLLRTAYVFCFCVPFGFADVLGWATPLAAAVLGYTFFGLDALGDELEEPFGERYNAVPIHALAVNIEIGLSEALGETPLPRQPKPVDGVLM